MRTIPTVPDTFEECSTPYSLRQSVAPLGADIAAAQSRRNLGVARCRQIPRDCAQIAHLHPGHPEALQCVAEGVEHSPEISRTPGIAGWRRTQQEWQHLAHGNSKPVWGSFARGRRASHVDPMRQRLPFSILAEFVATQQSRAFWISPGSALRPPPHCNASGWPGCRCAT